MSVSSARSSPHMFYDAPSMHSIFSGLKPEGHNPKLDPAVKTTTRSLNKHGDAILQLAHVDLHHAAEAKRFANHYHNVGRFDDAKDAEMQARAFQARGEFRRGEAAELHRKAKNNRTWVEKYGPLYWKVFVTLSITSMIVGIVGAWTSFEQLETIQRDAETAAKQRKNTAN